MKHLTAQDLYLLVKLVNTADDQVAAAADMTAMVRRQDLDYKGLPPETLEQQAKITVPIDDLRRKLKLIRQRLIAELQSETRQA